MNVWRNILRRVKRCTRSHSCVRYRGNVFKNNGRGNGIFGIIAATHNLVLTEYLVAIAEYHQIPTRQVKMPGSGSVMGGVESVRMESRRKCFFHKTGITQNGKTQNGKTQNG
jgi:hypothetical protein